MLRVQAPISCAGTRISVNPTLVPMQCAAKRTSSLGFALLGQCLLWPRLSSELRQALMPGFSYFPHHKTVPFLSKYSNPYKALNEKILLPYFRAINQKQSHHSSSNTALKHKASQVQWLMEGFVTIELISTVRCIDKEHFHIPLPWSWFLPWAYLACMDDYHESKHGMNHLWTFSCLYCTGSISGSLLWPLLTGI